MSLLLELLILILFIFWPWEYEFEAITWVHSAHNIWIEPYAIQMLFNGQPFIEASSLNCCFLLLFKLIVSTFPMFNAHLKDSKHVSDQISLNLFIDGRIVVKRGQMIDFKQPWLYFTVEHYIKA
jgi:hypothetical protein